VDGASKEDGGDAGGAGGVKVGYLVDVSCRNVSMSRGEDLIGIAKMHEQ
jgi:hypothetical protein